MSHPCTIPYDKPEPWFAIGYSRRCLLSVLEEDYGARRVAADVLQMPDGQWVRVIVREESLYGQHKGSLLVLHGPDMIDEHLLRVIDRARSLGLPTVEIKDRHGRG